MLPRIGLSRTSYGGISLQSLYSFATCAPNISKLVAFTPLYDVLNATGGGPPWASGEAPSQGVRPFAVAQGASHPAILGGWWGHVVPNPQKSYLRLVWHQYVVGGGCGCTPVPRKKKRRKRQNKVSNPLGPNFCKAHISKLVCASPFFFAFIAKSTSNSTQKCKKKFSHFLDPPLEKKFFFRLCQSSKSPKLRSFLFSSLK